MAYNFLQSGYPQYFRAISGKVFIILGIARWRVSFLRGHSLVHLFISHKAIGLYFLALMLPRYVKEFPDDIHSATSLLSFKKKLKAYLFTKPTHPGFYCIFQLSLYCGCPNHGFYEFILE